MRICLVTHAFPPYERTGVENYTYALAKAFVRAGNTVEVFAPRRDPVQAEFALRREEVDGFAVNWITLNHDPHGPREMLVRPEVAEEFGRFLDRERPEVVHFQHVVKLGIDLIQEARRRGIPTVYTAHDYYAICHRYTLLRPDLRHCDVRGDSMACARCDVALGFLNGIDELGDYQMGALPTQLDESQRDGLAGILEDEPERAGLTHDALDAAFDQRQELDGLRAEAFASLDLIIAPVPFMASELARGGVEAKRIEVLAYGIENEDLLDVEPINVDPQKPLRFGFFGGICKHKGVHVLLEAFGRLQGDASLSIWGASTDVVYVDQIREQAAAVGARWRGAYAREDLPSRMAEVDVVIAPSTWVENSPLVIREAFSAKRPVITSNNGALPESVRHEEDGLLFDVGDAGSLAAAMQRLCSEEGLLERLAGNIAPVKNIDRQAAELVERYGALVAAQPQEDVDVIPSLRDFVGRHRRLGELPSRELFRRALGGLDRLRRDWAGEKAHADTEELLAAALAGGSRTQVLVRDMKREVEWLRDTETDLEQGREILMRTLDEAHNSFEQVQARLTDTEDSLFSTEKTLATTAEELVKAQDRLNQTEKRLRERELRIQRAQVRLRQAAELGLLAMRTQEKIWNAELFPILARMTELTSDGPFELPADGVPNSEILRALQDRVEALENLRQELDWRRALVEQLDREVGWRRERMNELRGELAKVAVSDGALRAVKKGVAKQMVLRTEIGRLISGWRDGEWETEIGAGEEGEA